MHIPHHHDILIVIMYCMYIRIWNPNRAEARELWVIVAPTPGTAAISWLVTLASPSTVV